MRECDAWVNAWAFFLASLKKRELCFLFFSEAKKKAQRKVVFLANFWFFEDPNRSDFARVL